MNFSIKNTFLIVTLLLSGLAQAKVIVHKEDDLKLTLSGNFSSSSDANNNGSLLNSKAVGGRGTKVDRAYSSKSKVELTANIEHAKGAEAQITLRSKFGWGTPKASTSPSSVKYGEALIGSHSHNLGRNNIYIREAWVKLDLNKFSDWSLWNQTFIAGLFPFKLGKGIALGDAYLVDPISLGFFSDNSVDQFAPGMKFSGNLYWDSLEYDVYGSVTNNDSSKLKDTASQIYDQIIIDGAYVPSNKYARGSGYIDWRVVTRLRWTPVNNKDREEKIYFEPYVMYTRDPAQKLEFAGDASSKLGTLGFSGDFQCGSVEFGFDTAFNIGYQNVFAWDRNHITTQKNSTTGVLEPVHSHIYNEENLATKVAYIEDTADYRPSSGISRSMNSQLIAGTTKYNASNRFRDKYKNTYKGFMFVADASMYVYKRDVKISTSAGFSKGDTNPNTRTGSQASSERRYKGFLPQQELFSGDRVKSVFVMGPAGYLTRPNPLEEANTLATNTEGFTNIVFAGMGATWAPKNWAHKFNVNPNILTFWQDSRSKKLAAPTVDASNRLGTEINICSSFKPGNIENLNFKLTIAAFLPGAHYTDLKGTAMSSDIAKKVRKEADAGIAETLPTLGNSTAFTVSGGMEYSF